LTILKKKELCDNTLTRPQNAAVEISFPRSSVDLNFNFFGGVCP